MEHITVNKIEEETNKLFQDVTGEPRKEAHPESFSIFHTLATNVCGISSKSVLTAQRSVPSGLLSCLRHKQRAVSSFYSGGFGYIFCPPQLHKQWVNNVENINLEDAVLTTNHVTNINDSVKQAEDLPCKQIYPQAKNTLNCTVYKSTGRCGRDSFYNHNVPDIRFILNSTRIVPDIQLQ